MRSLLLICAIVFTSQAVKAAQHDEPILYNNIPMDQTDDTAADKEHNPVSPTTTKKRVNFPFGIGRKGSSEAPDPHKFSKEGYAIISQRVNTLETSQIEMGTRQQEMASKHKELAAHHKSLFDEVKRVAAQDQGGFIGMRYTLLTDFNEHKRSNSNTVMSLVSSVSTLEKDVKSLKQDRNVWRATTFVFGGAMCVFAYLNFKKR